MNYKHFTIEERCCLREYYVKGKSYRDENTMLKEKVIGKLQNYSEGM